MTNCVPFGERTKKKGWVINYEPYLRKDKTKFLMSNLAYFRPPDPYLYAELFATSTNQLLVPLQLLKCMQNSNFFIKVTEIKIFNFPCEVTGKRHPKYHSFPSPRTDKIVSQRSSADKL